jgi:thiol-disulfide isomerase/thioredoxin
MRAITLALRLIMVALLFAHNPARAAEPKLGQPAPNAQFTAVSGAKFDLASLRGQVVVINFWATWCGPCRKELPLLDAYYRAQKTHGLIVLAATTEDSLPEYTMRKLFAAMAITPLHHLKGPYAPLQQSLPTNFVIDRAGVLRYAQPGAFSLDELNQVLVPLLSEPAPAAGAATTASAAAPHPARFSR